MPNSRLPMQSPHEAWQREPGGPLRVTWLGHSTVLLELNGKRILTDPVFGNRASPFSFAGPKRFHQPPSRIKQLPQLDAILLSHDHFDHLCASSITKLAQLDIPIVTSLGVGARLSKLGFRPQNIKELDWWETASLLGGSLSMTATPAQHFSGRSLTDRNATLWSSWVIETDDTKVFFSGDTGLTEEFCSIHETFGAFDLIMLEVGAWDPLWRDLHLGPEGALRAFEMLGGGTLVPIHWATFDLALHPWQEPAETLVRLAGSDQRILTPELGQVFEPDQVEATPRWWRPLR